MPLKTLPTPAEMAQFLDTCVRGQTAAKRLLSLAFYEHYTGLASAECPELEGPAHHAQHVLLLGPSGCGKTWLVRQLCRYLGVPVVFWGATSLTEAGYVGDDVEEPLKQLLRQCRGDASRAHHGVVVLDEIDKVRIAHGNVRDVSGEGVQTGLLTLLDGRRMFLKERSGEPMGEIDTSKLLFVCMGAFVDLPGIVRARFAGGPAPLGLSTPARAATPVLTDDDAYARATPEDLVDFGFLPEFVGRFPNGTAIHTLEEEDLVGLMRDLEESPVNRLVRGYAAHGLRLEIEDDALRAIAQRARSRGTGARGLENALGDALRDCTWRRHELFADGVSRVVVTRDAALGEAGPTLVRGPHTVIEGLPLPADVLRERAFQRVRAHTHVQQHEEALARTNVSERDPRRPRPADPRQQEMRLELAPPCAPALPPRLRPPGNEREIRRRLLVLRAKDLQFAKATPAMRAWWDEFEHRRPLALVLHVAEELAARNVTLAMFHDHVRRSGTLGVHANLRWLDYVRERDAFEGSRELLELVRPAETDKSRPSRIVQELEQSSLPPVSDN